MMILNLKAPRTSNYFDRTDTLVRYYNEIREYPILNEEEEKKLLFIIKNGDKKSSIEARNELVVRNQRIVLAVAKRFGTNDNLPDLIEEGNFGLIKSIEDFNLDYENRFITFAIHYIRREINQYLIRNGSIVKQNNISKTYHVKSQAINSFIQRELREPTDEELRDILSEEYNVEIKDLGDIRRTTITSIDDSQEDDDECHNIGEMVLYNSYSATSNDYVKTSEKESQNYAVESLLKKLTPRESEIIKLVFGIGYDRSYELQEISKKIGLTTERVRQLKFSTLEKLKELTKDALRK